MNHKSESWRVGTPKGFNADIVYVDDGEEFPDGICSVFGVPLHSTVEGVEKIDRPEIKDALAKARLIAAAPELLRACEKALEWVCDADLAVPPSMGVLSGEDMARMLHAAIAKAKGEA